MGLFRKKKDDPTEREALLAEIEQLRRRLDEADVQKERLYAQLHLIAEKNMTLDERVRSLDIAREELDERLASIDEARASLDDRVRIVSTTNDDLQDRIGSVATLSDRVQELADRLTTEPPTIPPPPPVLHDPRVETLTERLAIVEARNQEIDDLHRAVAALADASDGAADDERLAELAARLDTVIASIEAQREDVDTVRAGLGEVDSMRDELGQTASKLSALDSRMRSISFELTNQLTELSDDLERLLERPEIDLGPQVDPDQLQFALTAHVDEKVNAALGAIQQSTERLAAEQARYEIQFREDLAELAARFRTPAMR